MRMERLTLADLRVTGIDSGYVDFVCKLGQGEQCCAFLMMGLDGFECAKDSGFELTIRARLKRGTMGAKGDNCEGWGTQ